MAVKINVLKYFGGQEEDLGGFLEALRVEKLDEFLFPVYILHEMKQRRDIKYDDYYDRLMHGKIINDHKIAFYITEAELLKAHERAWSFLNEIRETVTLHETDNVLGLNISPEEFYGRKS